MASAPASSSISAEANSRLAPPVAPKPSWISRKQDDDHEQKRESEATRRINKTDGQSETIKLQEQITKRRFAEKHASEEILELETKIEKKEKRLRLVKRFAEAEQIRLENEVYKCLHLKEVLEEEAASFSFEDNERAKMTEDIETQVSMLYAVLFFKNVECSNTHTNKGLDTYTRVNVRLTTRPLSPTGRLYT
ncbi:hypothetical protein MAR_031870 [Mya arenaria]|uniref:Uncharacterized protein n=1 Tax=Mya arenaria TaxID=6604 RepID=A0ABY7FDB9_MYAAR|nr:hypothetical protein MAR_031870 [Mya arenaria]